MAPQTLHGDGSWLDRKTASRSDISIVHLETEVVQGGDSKGDTAASSAPAFALACVRFRVALPHPGVVPGGAALRPPGHRELITSGDPECFGAWYRIR